MPRKPLPARRPNWKQKAVIEGQTFYLTFGEYPDGQLGEIFVNAAKEGALVRVLLDALARVTSLALQHEAPVSDLVHAMKGLKGGPAGAVFGSSSVSECQSIPDWIAREMEIEYVRRGSEAEVKRVAGVVTQGSGV